MVGLQEVSSTRVSLRVLCRVIRVALAGQCQLGLLVGRVAEPQQEDKDKKTGPCWERLLGSVGEHKWICSHGCPRALGDWEGNAAL